MHPPGPHPDQARRRLQWASSLSFAWTVAGLMAYSTEPWVDTLGLGAAAAMTLIISTLLSSARLIGARERAAFFVFASGLLALGLSGWLVDLEPGPHRAALRDIAIAYQPLWLQAWLMLGYGLLARVYRPTLGPVSTRLVALAYPLVGLPALWLFAMLGGALGFGPLPTICATLVLLGVATTPESEAQLRLAVERLSDPRVQLRGDTLPLRVEICVPCPWRHRAAPRRRNPVLDELLGPGLETVDLGVLEREDPGPLLAVFHNFPQSRLEPGTLTLVATDEDMAALAKATQTDVTQALRVCVDRAERLAGVLESARSKTGE